MPPSERRAREGATETPANLVFSIKSDQGSEAILDTPGPGGEAARQQGFPAAHTVSAGGRAAGDPLARPVRR